MQHYFSFSLFIYFFIYFQVKQLFEKVTFLHIYFTSLISSEKYKQRFVDFQLLSIDIGDEWTVY